MNAVAPLIPVLCLVLAWKGLMTPRPAPARAELEPTVLVRASGWTHAFCATLLLASTLLALHVSRQGGRSLMFGLPVALVFCGVASWMWWDFSQGFELGTQSLRVSRPGCRDRTLSFRDLRELEVSPPYFVVRVVFADGTRITFLPCLWNADEGARRVLVAAPPSIVDALGGEGGDAVRRLRERNARAQQDA